MSRPDGSRPLLTRQDFLRAAGVLLVVRDPPPPLPPAPGQPPVVPANPEEGPEVLLAVWEDGGVTALHGHVDLGTGLQTALAQIVAEELDVALAAVQMVLGDTARAPNQGPTIASASIQIHAEPLRRAAAQARARLLVLAAEALGAAPERMTVRDGVVTAGAAPSTPVAPRREAAPSARSIRYADLLHGRHERLLLDPGAPTKPAADYRIVGQPVPRLDIPAKAFGEEVFVHDLRLPGMLHGRVVRPPYAGADHGEFIGNSLEAVDEASIAHIPGVRAVVVIRDFVGVVADREEDAERAAAELRVRWNPWPGLPPLADLAQALRTNPATPRRLVDEGDVDAALAAAQPVFEREYLWPYQLHASIGPSCAVAAWLGPVGAAGEGAAGSGSGTVLRVFAGTQNPHVLRSDLARLTGLTDVQVDVVRMEAAGCYGRNGADDVAADAVLLARAVAAAGAVGVPVRVQLSREQEHLWEPKGAAQLMRVRGAVDAQGGVAAYDFDTSYPSNAAPTLALLLTRTIEPGAVAYQMGDRTARWPYAVPNHRVTVNDMAPILRASWLRGVSALPNAFAHESFVDELAQAAGADPLEYRLRHLPDERAAELLHATAARAGWRPHTAAQQQGADGEWLLGQGVAYARYNHSKWPGFGAAWSAWVADVAVHRDTGEVHVKRVVVGHDAGLMINPAGVEHQVHGNVLQTTSRALKESLPIEPRSHLPAAKDWGRYPILSFRELPVVEVLTMPRPDQPPLGAGESSSVPGTAAIANAIFDATGVRFRQPPFTPEVVRAALHPLPGPAAGVAGSAGAGPASPATAAPTVEITRSAPAGARWPRGKRFSARVLALATAGVGVLAALLGWRAGIAPLNAPLAPIPGPGGSVGLYSAATLERGRQLAALGNCADCHTAAVPGAARNAGGLAIETPFGTVYSSNITPDAETGIGRWSLAAFQRAMRQGLSRDGRHLYPAFPYTAFAALGDDDLTALYAHLMAAPAVHNGVPAAALRFPFNLRPLLGLWNALFLESKAAKAADPSRSALWNRGAELVNGIAHCGACHTPRNGLGAERGGTAFLAGAMVKGWEAPSLTALSSRTPVPWTESELFRYLRHGHSPLHGPVSGPMAPVVANLATVNEDDLRAMAHYIASFNPPLSEEQARSLAAAQVARARQAEASLLGPTQRLFQTACGACHHEGDGPQVLGTNTPLALSTKLHSEQPDNLLRVILEGVQQPATAALGFMPGFAGVYDDRQIVELAAYLRARYAPGRPAWRNLEAALARVRSPR